MQHRNHHIQRMSRADLGLALQWADQEGWNPGRQDTDIFHPIDVRGHFLLDEGGMKMTRIERHEANVGHD